VGGTLAPLSLGSEIICGNRSWKNIKILLHHSSMFVNLNYSMMSIQAFLSIWFNTDNELP
jgi:hypothetical protein